MNRCCFENTRKLNVRAWLVYCIVVCTISLVPSGEGARRSQEGFGERRAEVCCYVQEKRG